MTTAITEPPTAARAAAEWWAKQVGAPVFRQVEARQRDLGSIFTETALSTLAARNPVPAGAESVFADELEKRIEEMFGRTDRVSLGVDYGPDLELAEAAKAAGISTARFPIKTHLWAYRDHVTASLGYRGQTRLIWSHPDWVRPACESLEYDERTNQFGDNRCSLPRFHDGDHGDWKPDPRRCKGCGLTEGGHYNRTDKGDYHSFQAAES